MTYRNIQNHNLAHATVQLLLVVASVIETPLEIDNFYDHLARHFVMVVLAESVRTAGKNGLRIQKSNLLGIARDTDVWVTC